MHDGRFKTLEQAVSYNNKPFMFVVHSVNIFSTLKRPLGIALQEKNDPVSFLKTPTDRAYSKR